MHIIHKTIWIPKISQTEVGTDVSNFSIGPLPRWYWITLWNSLRRVLLSSIPGTRVTWIKVSWVSHEYSTLPWIKDTIVDIMLNLKELVLDKDEVGIEWIRLTKNKAWIVKAADIKAGSTVTVLNKDLYITEIDKDWINLDIEIRVEKWVGYLSIDELKKREDDVAVLLLDANFSPVTSVKYEIEKARFWDITDLDTLSLVISTNWTLSPIDCLKFSWDMLKSYFSIFNETSLQVEGHFINSVKDLLEKEKEEVKWEMEKETYTPIEIMWLSPRTLNALINWNILSTEQLTKCTETKLSSIKWFGKKAMTEIKESLAEMGLKLLGDD